MIDDGVFADPVEGRHVFTSASDNISIWGNLPSTYILLYVLLFS